MKKNLLEEIKLRIKQPVFFEGDEIIYVCTSHKDNIPSTSPWRDGMEIGQIRGSADGTWTVEMSLECYTTYDIPSIEEAKELFTSKWNEYVMEVHILPYLNLNESN